MAWKFFAVTGYIGAYLFYKELLRMEGEAATQEALSDATEAQ
ncbi:MAG: YqzL family protein [Clostridia bacterium]|nr:YqzL family protein [Clostridia bacterium]